MPEATVPALVTSRPRLGRTALAQRSIASDVVTPTEEMLALPERVVQFGTGALLRGLVDFFIDRANAAGAFQGRVVAIATTPSGRHDAFATQDGLYTLISRGIVQGAPVDERRVVGSVSRVLSASTEWAEVLACAHNPELAVIVSNTTEVGLVLDEHDDLGAAPPRTFPGKLTRFLFERARAFAFDPVMGVVVLPCELIERNGDTLRDMVLAHATRVGYPPAFHAWIAEAVPFCNTLVDRIVPGTPRSTDAELLAEQLGVDDALLTCAEPYRLLAIEANAAVAARLGFCGADPGIVVTGDVEPYRRRKVALLNGGHTISVSAALLAGCGTVKEAMAHTRVGPFIRHVVRAEILPTVDAPNAADFADAVLDRFGNPHIEHALLDITLHGTTKMRVRLVPTFTRAVKQAGRVPRGLAFGMAAHLAWLSSDARAAFRASGRAPVDELGEQLLRTHPVDDAFVASVLGDMSIWMTNLAVLPGFAADVDRYFRTIRSQGITVALTALNEDLA